MPILNALKMTIHLMMMGTILGLLLTLPQIASQRHMVVQACEVLMGESQKSGVVTMESYHEFWKRMKDAEMDHQIRNVSVLPGLDQVVQKRSPMVIRLNVDYKIRIPFIGERIFRAEDYDEGDVIVVQVFSHKYFK